MIRTTIVLSLLLATPAFADDPKFVYAKPEEVKEVKDVNKVEWTAAAEGGIVFTTGNSETTTVSGGFKASRKAGDNKLSIEGSVAYAKSGLLALQDKNGNGTIDNEGEITTVESVTAETLAAKTRYDRFLTDFNSLFVALLAGRDLPAGKQSVFGGQLGYSRRIYKTKTAEMVGEFGYDFSREDLVVGSPVSIHSLRAFVGYKAAMTQGTNLDVAIEGLTNLNKETLPTGQDGSAFKDTRLNTKLAIASKVSKNMQAQMAIESHFDNRPGPLAIKNLAMGFVPPAQKLDTIMKASLIYAF